ncbi:hypothetical protein SSE37_05827 [Sagittula stellata E-37]|uniref:DUF1028 domain-containing protein n=1 Tax=Sagittula stellata (strain ATCC 700073 / DSM 11524 / E-37) TaxID=388399 RepID=A3K9K6_SAGS3|nr:hypothetical protein SSE37_05827 [Sagittula stellata E-37]
MTFSLVGRCAETGMFGIVISSSSPAVAARCSYARAGVGAVASGSSAAEAVRTVRRDGSFMDYRQVLAVDAKGGTAIHSGSRALGIWTEAQAQDAAACGNLLANDGIPRAMVEAYANATGHIGDRLITACAPDWPRAARLAPCIPPG